MKTPEAPHAYPTVYVRLRLIQSNPPLPLLEVFQQIWTRGPRFHIRDESGRTLSSLLEDVGAERGLGADPHSLEDIMDRSAQSTREPIGTTDLFGDLSTGDGVVSRLGQSPWRIDAWTLTPIVHQIFASHPLPSLSRCGTAVRLGRECIEYRGLLAGSHAGVPYSSDVTQLVSGGYLILGVVRDRRNPNHSYTREIVTLQEGNMQEHDLIPPEIAH